MAHAVRLGSDAAETDVGATTDGSSHTETTACVTAVHRSQNAWLAGTPPALSLITRRILGEKTPSRRASWMTAHAWSAFTAKDVDDLHELNELNDVRAPRRAPQPIAPGAMCCTDRRSCVPYNRWGSRTGDRSFAVSKREKKNPLEQEQCPAVRGHGWPTGRTGWTGWAGWTHDVAA